MVMAALVSAVVLVILSFPMQTWAQATSGAVVGSVLDATGAAVPNAQVTATNIATGVKKTAKSNPQGEYRLDNLQIGNYKIEAQAPGFAAAAVNRSLPWWARRALLAVTTCLPRSMALST